MDTSTFLILAAIGLAAGTLGGMVGLGGGILIIPAMVYFLGVDQRMAQGTSIAIMLPPIGLLAAFNYYKHQICDRYRPDIFCRWIYWIETISGAAGSDSQKSICRYHDPHCS
jgi:uncharacterized membrane protein YfcA